MCGRYRSRVQSLEVSETGEAEEYLDKRPDKLPFKLLIINDRLGKSKSKIRLRTKRGTSTAGTGEA
jgi:hypothetical protein